MIAGLPRVRSLFFFLLLVSLAGVLASAQDIQTPSLLPEDPYIPPAVQTPSLLPEDPYIPPAVQTPSLLPEDPVVQTPSVSLDAIIQLIEGNPIATADQTAAMLDALGPVVEQEILTEDQALEILSVIGWATLDDPERIDEAIAAVASVGSQLLLGTLLGDPVAEVSDLWADALTPDGIVNSIEKAADRAGLDESTADPVLDRVEDLVVAGFPPGIVLRVVKDALRNGDDPLEVLAALEDASEDASFGNAANAATGNGQFKHQETEENANQEPNEEPEAEDNNHGQGRVGKTEDEDPEEPAEDEDEDEDESERAGNSKTNNGKQNGKKK